MSRSLQSLTFAVIFFLMAGVSLANAETDALSVKITPDSSAVYAGKTATYTASITNKQDVADTFDIFVRARAKTTWVTINTFSVDVESGRVEDITFYITPPYGTKQDTYVFDFDVVSQTDSNISIQKEVVLYVLAMSGLNTTTFRPSKSVYDIGEKVTLLVGIRNTGTSTSKKSHMILRVSGATSAERTIDIPALEVDEERIFTEEFIFDMYSASGVYGAYIEIINELGDKIGTATTSFSIDSKAIFEKDEITEGGILGKKTEITIRNRGNKRATETVMIDSPFLISAYNFESPPLVERIDGQKKLVWQCELAPNESCTIRYEVRYWICLLVIVFAIILMFVIIREVQKPGIKKRVIKGAEHTVHIEIKNNSRKMLDDVQVSDLVPAAFVVVEKYGTVRPSMVKKRTAGTDIVWRIGKISPGEERIFSYKIRPILDVVGKIEMPRAKIFAKDSKGKITKNISSKVVVE